MVRPLPSGSLLATGALSLNLTWQTDSESQHEARARGLPGRQASTTLSLVWALYYCPGAWAGELYQAPGRQVHAPGSKVDAVQPLG